MAEQTDTVDAPAVPEWHAASYLAGFRAAVPEGYRLGCVDLERAKSEAAAEGYRRGRDAQLSFGQAERGPAGNSGAVMVLFGIGLALLVRRVQRLEDLAAATIAEGTVDELPDVRS